MNEIINPMDYPILEGGPGIVDSRALYIKAMNEGKAQPIGDESPDYTHEAWLRWAKFPLGFADELESRGITYWKLGHDQPAMDFDPGKNRVSLFADARTREYEINLLNQFGAQVNFLAGTSMSQILKGRADIHPPYVLKNIAINKGRGKLLVQDEKSHRRVVDYLNSRNNQTVQNLIAEDYCEPPGEHNATYRLTMTPGGRIHGAAITRSKSKKNGSRAASYDAGVLLPLVDQTSPYYINSPRITSNIDGDKTYIALDFEGRWYEMVPPDVNDESELEAHGIDPAFPALPEKVRRAGVEVSRILGPGIGMHVGIDFIQSKDGEIYLLEANPDPEYTSIFKTMLPIATMPTADNLRSYAFVSTLDDLAAGRFTQSQVAQPRD